MAPFIFTIKYFQLTFIIKFKCILRKISYDYVWNIMVLTKIILYGNIYED
ncbi:hypothetical protein TEMA_00290 [Terrisporobacter mayombei]|uniref:Uncharacterized protein n=1 Tax=Terrisporobacter mayombei TaxID=1541 RepID=A0ABY9PVN5_9FIRM|nr:hypothetical protein TEMA_00290 [Terrisporobacter mayombei]